MNLPDLNALASREAEDKAIGKALHEIASDLRAAVSVKVSALQAVTKKLEAMNQPSRAEALTLAATRLTADPLDFNAVATLRNVVDALVQSAQMLGSVHHTTESTPGAVAAPCPARPDDYERSTRRYEQEYADYLQRREAAMHPIDATASRNGLR
ncbi:hypothetical protein ACOCG7_24825 [Paraburkholderia sp. DD10]|jgi:hypothetical protein|uniref:hypothetical protein n=1 Tax=Paraburkholderia TaxID=1822464 RepID=UPI003A07CAEE